MKGFIVLLMLLIAKNTFAADCFWAVNLSCQKSDVTVFSEINLVLSGSYKRGSKICPDSTIVGIQAAFLLQEKNLIGEVCNSNEAGELLRIGDSFGSFAVVFNSLISKNPENEAKERAQSNTEKCVEAGYTDKCLIVDEYAPISIDPYLP